MLSDICFDMIDLIKNHHESRVIICNKDIDEFLSWLDNYSSSPFDYPVEVINPLRLISKASLQNNSYSKLNEACISVVNFYAPHPEDLASDAYQVLLSKLNNLIVSN